ncbi:hypothetical protein ElP_41560 [Tautonia plasticadhaerens]|uniref:Transposase IS701-like DDE domain-containing protein n=1 Tax=Tautonia plasticadhaerens TaxID=2527974 RepID=A0A518H5X3_9BACT|nr:hypothetical protein ElP_41560 [Tautonia plasticadhaerens]
MTIPPEARPLLDALACVFTQPTPHRFVILFGSAILTTGRRTVADILRPADPGASDHLPAGPSSAEWSALRLACQTCRLVLAPVPADQAVILVGDDTAGGHPGRRVYGEARQRDPVPSGHGYTAWRYGHPRVVLAMIVRFPWATRPWALSVLADPDRSEEGDRERCRPHRTPARIMATLSQVMLGGSPDRESVFVGDSGYGAHELARFAHRLRGHLCLVSEPHPEANLFDPPPPYGGQGTAPGQGTSTPQAQAGGRGRHASGPDGGLVRRRRAAGGGGRRHGALVQGRREADTPDVDLRARRDRDAPGRILLQHRPDDDGGGDDRRLPRSLGPGDHLPGGASLARTGEHQGLVSADGARAAPRLPGLYTVVALLYQCPPEAERSGRVECPGKAGMTSSDALTSVRRRLGREWVSPRAGGCTALDQLPEAPHKALFYALAPAA